MKEKPLDFDFNKTFDFPTNTISGSHLFCPPGWGEHFAKITRQMTDEHLRLCNIQPNTYGTPYILKDKDGDYWMHCMGTGSCHTEPITIPDEMKF